MSSSEPPCEALARAADEGMPIPRFVLRVMERLYSAGFDCYLVGGCVRDYLRGSSPKDYDIAANARADKLMGIFSSGFKVVATGLKHGTVTVVSEGRPVEVTAYRIDGTYSDGRHPDAVTFTPRIEDDLSRRDFTMNALAYSPRGGLVDLFGGREDIIDGCVRCVGDPKIRFGEDALRILRALRFAAVLGFHIDKSTARAIHSERGLLGKISAERVTSELLLLICGKCAAAVMREYRDVLAEALPEIRVMFDFPQNHPYHIYDVWEHTLRTVENVPPSAELRMAALLHDIGKPSCRTVDENGVDHFYGHAEMGAKIAEQCILKRLRLPKAQSERIIALVKNHGVSLVPDRKIMRRRLIKFSEETLRQLMELARADALAQSPAAASRLDELEECGRILDEILAAESCFSVKNLAVDGRDVMNLGVPQGRFVGEILDRLLGEVSDELLANEREPLLHRAAALWEELRQLHGENITI